MMKDYVALNKIWWEKVVPIHLNSKLYDLKGFKKGKSSLSSIEKEELGNVTGKSVLHLMCHFGLDSLSLARAGAKVTGVDLSSQAIKTARQLSEDLKIPAKFICSDVYDLEKVLDEKFDLIFVSYGVLCWLKDLKKWAKIINHFLKPGAAFYLVELHPLTNIFSYDFKLAYKYFKKGPEVDDSDGTYADWDAKIKGKTYLWNYTLSDVINSLISEGLTLKYLHEFPFTMYDQFPGLMKKNKKGQYFFKSKKIEIPLLFSLMATKS